MRGEGERDEGVRRGGDGGERGEGGEGGVGEEEGGEVGLRRETLKYGGQS